MVRLSKKVFFNTKLDSKSRLKPIDHKRFKNLLYDSTGRSTLIFVEKFYRYYGKYYSDIYAVSKRHSTKLVLRKIQNNQIIVFDKLYCSALGGYKVDYKYQGADYYYLSSNQWNIGFYMDIEGYNIAFNEHPVLKYLDKKEVLRHGNLIDIISYIEIEPRIERLFKVGLGKYFKSYRRFKFDKKGFKNQFLVDYKNLGKVDCNTLNDILIYQECNFTEEEFKLYKRFRNNHKIRFKNNKQRAIIVRYLLSKIGNNPHKEWNLFNMYEDNYNLLVALHKDLMDKYWIAPKNLNKLHDKLIQEKTAYDKLQLEEKAKFEKDNLQHFNETFGVKKLSNFKVYIPTLAELSEVAETMSLCLVSNNYYGKLANKQTLILFISEDEKVREVAEIKNNKLWQLRGPNNQDSQYHEDIQELLLPHVQEYQKEFKKIKVRNSC